MFSKSNHQIAALHSFLLEKGNTWYEKLSWRLKNSTTKLNLQGSNPVLRVWQNEGDETVLKELAIGSGLALSQDGTELIIDTMVDLDSGHYYHELDLNFSATRIYTIAKGPVIVS